SSVSVVVAVYNGADLLHEALESIAGQTLEPADVIIVDDGSTDASASVAESVAAGRDGWRLIRQPNRGPAAARNAGIAAASGALVPFLGAAAILVPHRLAVSSAYLDAHPECGFVIPAEETVVAPGIDAPFQFRRFLEKGMITRPCPISMMVR